MATEVATAYVEILPELRTFAARLRAGVRAAVGGIGPSAGRAFGVGFDTARVAVARTLKSVALLSVVGAAAAAGLTVGMAGVGLAIAGVGIAAAAQSQVVKSAFGDLTTDVKAQLVNIAAPLEPVLVGLAGTLRTAFGQIAPFLRQAFASLAPALGSLFSALGPALAQLGPVIANVARAVTPLITTLGRALGPVVADLGQALVILARAAGSVAPVFGQLLTTLGGILPPIARLLAALVQLGAPVLGALLGFLGPVITALSGVLAPVLAQLTPVIAQMAKTLAGSLGSALAALLPPLAGLIGQLVGALLPAITPLIPIVIQVASVIAGVLVQGLRILLSAVTQLLPVLSRLLQSVGNALVSALQQVTPALLSVVQAFARLLPALVPVFPVLGQLVTALLPVLVELITALAPVLVQIIGMWGQLLVALLPILPPLAQLIVALLPVVAWLGRLAATILSKVIPVLAGLLTWVVRLAAGIIGVLLNAITWLVRNVPAAWNTVAAAVGGAMQRIRAIIGPILSAVRGLFAAAMNFIRTIVQVAWRVIRALFTGNLADVKRALREGLAQIRVSWSGVWSAIRRLSAAVWAAIRALVRGGITAVRAAVSAGLNAVRGLWSRGWAAVRSAHARAWQAIGSAAASAAGRLVSFMRALPGRLVRALGNLGGLLVSAGNAIISGLWRGISSAAAWLRDRLISLIKSIIPGPVRKVLGIGSPSKVMAQIGQYTMDGLYRGLSAGAGRVEQLAAQIGQWTAKTVAGAIGHADVGWQQMDKIRRQIMDGLLRGMTGDADKIRATAARTADLIRKAFAGIGQHTRADDRLLAGLKASTARLVNLAQQREQVMARIAEAREFAGQVTEGARSFASVTALDFGDAAPTAEGIKTGLASRLGALRTFATNLRELARRGLSKTMLRQIIEAGPEQGAALAEALIKADAETFSAINSTQRQIDATAKNLGLASADVLYDAGRGAGRGFLTGLLDQQKRIEQAMGRIARSLADQIRNAFIDWGSEGLPGVGKGRLRPAVSRTPWQISRPQPLRLAAALNAPTAQPGPRAALHVEHYHEPPAATRTPPPTSCCGWRGGEADMPAPVAVPTRPPMTPGQVRWRGLLLGDGTDYLIHSLTGWRELPATDNGNTARPSRHGAWPGRALTQERTVTAELTIAPADGDVARAVATLETATALSEDAAEEELAVADFSAEPRIALGQLTRRSLPLLTGYLHGITGAALQWACADPRLYSAAEQETGIPAPTPGSGGLAYPLDYSAGGLNYGEPGRPGQATATNDGNTAAHPLLGLAGPVTGPRIINQATGAALVFDITLADGEQLDIDCGAGTVTLNGSADRLYTLTAASAPVEAFTLPPGPNVIALLGASFGSSAELAVRWRHAHL